MIFGFNTDVKVGDTVYHVQSEARKADQLLQTQVFVRGRCIGKKATSYAENVASPDFNDDRMHEMLKSQHKTILEAVRESRVEAMLEKSDSVRIASPAAASSNGGELSLTWDNAHSVYKENNLHLLFTVTEAGKPVTGATLISRFLVANSQEPPIFSQAVTDENGSADMKIFLDEAALADAAVLVQATVGEKHATRKFRLHRHS
jgi:hypothetical protein